MDWCNIQERIAKANIIKGFPSSRSFMVLGPTFRSFILFFPLIHFELLFVCGVMEGSNSIPLYVYIHFPNMCMCVCARARVHSVVSNCLQHLCDAMDCSPPGSSVHGVSQARIVE